MSLLSIVNARLIDPASGRDEEGGIVCEDGKIIEIGDIIPRGDIIDAGGLILCPGLIDMRVRTGEPGRENRETLATAAQAAIAGGVTSVVLTPQTDPVIDNVSLVDYLIRKGEDLPFDVYISGALTKGLDGVSLTEIGLMREAGAVLFSNGSEPIGDAQIMRRLMSYAANFNALIANRAVEPSLSADTVAHESNFSSRLGLTASPAISERIMAERDIALAELTGGSILIDLISSKAALESIIRAKSRDLDVYCSVSVNHLCLNELDIGDYRSFAKLSPPLREESDRMALLNGINEGAIDVVVSDHDPRPAGEKRLPYAEAASGAVGLEILLSAGLTQVADGHLDLMAFLSTVTCNPADLLGLDCGRLAIGAPANLALIDPHKPWICESDKLRSRSKNTPFDGRRLTGRAVKTFYKGKEVFSL
ncbi:dihydroorotase [Litorimonas taeanensis]|uniref:Dihydroorotase n=1 Tax=Litorimonas taeanensis TaxID=568099 RepID=A0A420WLM1_9PROT|nr:dihydroorotase [Litorimonas taeanensis]RKQ71923.1 dihydroorotase [Litorimonas taeanensis]